jgi:hypothetical protein
MSGVTTGTRLEQLYRLRDRVAQEIAHEERLVAQQRGRPMPPVEPFKRPGRVGSLLAELGVTGAEVNEWALRVGLITHKKRGRVDGRLVEAYALHVGPKR